MTEKIVDRSENSIVSFHEIVGTLAGPENGTRGHRKIEGLAQRKAQIATVDIVSFAKDIHLSVAEIDDTPFGVMTIEERRRLVDNLQKAFIRPGIVLNDEAVRFGCLKEGLRCIKVAIVAANLAADEFS